MDAWDIRDVGGPSPRSEPAWRFQRVGAGPLPVFVHRGDDHAVFYAPRGTCVVPSALLGPVEQRLERAAGGAALDECALDLVATRNLTAVDGAAATLVDTARRAMNEATETTALGFRAECLTLFLNNCCNLRCRYCHALPSHDQRGGRSPRSVSLEAVRSAGEMVAAACARQGLPFTVVFHGGGEPTLDRSLAEAALDALGSVARNHGVPLRTYIATNGVMPEESARWVALRFDLVGLSCDGPPDVQERQRPARDGLPTSPRVERTARILREAGRPFHVRATITEDSVERQPEIAAYLMENLAPAEVRLEPVYDSAAAAGLRPAAAQLFVEGFLEARRVAAEMGTTVTTSMVRPGHLHGRHCNVLRGVVNLVPGDSATACFLESGDAGLAGRGVRVGSTGASMGLFALDGPRVEALATRCAEIPAGCEECLCCYQCDHGCPDICAVGLTGGSEDGEIVRAGFRCRAHRLLMEAMVLEAADEAWCFTAPGTRRECMASRTGLRVAVFRDGPGRDSEL